MAKTSNGRRGNASKMALRADIQELGQDPIRGYKPGAASDHASKELRRLSVQLVPPGDERDQSNRIEKDRTFGHRPMLVGALRRAVQVVIVL